LPSHRNKRAEIDPDAKALEAKKWNN